MALGEPARAPRTIAPSAAAAAAKRPDEALPVQDAQLLDYLDWVDRHRAGRRAIHLHLSRLLAHNRRDQHLRIAVSTFEDLVKQYDGQIFLLGNGDIVFIAKGASAADIDAAVTRVRFLFSEDPLAQDGGNMDQFATWYNLESHYNDYYSIAKRLAAETERKKRAARGPTQGAETGGKKRHPLDPALLAKLEDFLARADMSNLMRRQAICAMTPGAQPQAMFRELFISIADLQGTVIPDVDLFADPWLFQRLTQTLDRRILALMTRNDDSTLNSAFSLNLNVSTILSPEFLAFDKAFKSNSRGTVVIEMQKIDIFADLGAFFFARDFLKERGYKICLDGINFMTFPFIDRAKLGVDMLKIVWSQEMTAEQPARGGPTMKELVESTGRARVILSRIDNDAAVRFGHSMGVTLFQGRHLDTLLANRSGPLGR
ncbi:MAG: EAL domain-containing protein [Alphaproteobacteria bacterium]|nr:EAL domain-containing protein [Alphaproteobacteria bacterium]